MPVSPASIQPGKSYLVEPGSRIYQVVAITPDGKVTVPDAKRHGRRRRIHKPYVHITGAICKRRSAGGFKIDFAENMLCYHYIQWLVRQLYSYPGEQARPYRVS